MPRSSFRLLANLTVAALLILLPMTTFGLPSEDDTTIEGQLVCSVCWFEADRNTVAYGTASDIDCAKDCLEKGIPPAIAVKNGKDYTLYALEPGKFKQDQERWLQAVGKWVKASGQVRKEKDKIFLAVNEFQVVRDTASGQKIADFIGSEVELSLKDLLGVEQKLSSYKGKIVVLNFWATWCVPCRKEMPDLAAIQNSYAPLGVQVVGAAANSLAERQKVLQFIKTVGVNFPVWLGATTADMQRFGLGVALPGTVIIGRDGKIFSATPGTITEAELKKQLDSLLKFNETVAVASKEKSDVSLVPS